MRRLTFYFYATFFLTEGRVPSLWYVINQMFLLSVKPQLTKLFGNKHVCAPHFCFVWFRMFVQDLKWL